jgi:hypothetical protein
LEKRVGANNVLVGTTLVFVTMGVSAISTLAQAERISNKKRFSNLFINS